MSKMTNEIELVLTFDTTGSMYPCLTQVRRKSVDMASRLMREIPGIRIAVIAHGDYCDAPGRAYHSNSYVTKALDFTSDLGAVTRFIENVGATGGGDSEECYELVMAEAQDLSWTKGYKKALVMIGDDVPHSPAEARRQGGVEINWRTEMDKLGAMGINVYGVQALNRGHATRFWQEIAEKTGGFHLNLDQFHEVTDLLLAIAYKQTGDDALLRFEEEIEKSGRMSRSNERVFNTLLRRTELTPHSKSEHKRVTAMGATTSRYERADKLEAVRPGRFQMLEVDHDCSISDFVRSNGAEFRVGRGFYEMTKRETIQARKEVILMDRRSGDMFTGHKAREILGLPDGVETRIAVPENVLDKYVIFVQSTSSNRKLIGGTRFLYEVNDYAVA